MVYRILDRVRAKMAEVLGDGELGRGLTGPETSKLCWLGGERWQKKVMGSLRELCGLCARREVARSSRRGSLARLDGPSRLQCIRRVRERCSKRAKITPAILLQPEQLFGSQQHLPGVDPSPNLLVATSSSLLSSSCAPPQPSQPRASSSVNSIERLAAQQVHSPSGHPSAGEESANL